MDYVILRARSLEILQEKVNHSLRNGYKLDGHILAGFDGYYIQAVVLI